MSTKKPEPDFTIVDNVSRILDTKYTIPGTRFTFGLDPLIGLIPFAGDSVTFLISSALVIMMVRYGVSGNVVVRMIINVLLDTLIGSIPVLGNIFDFFFKANTRNARLLREHYEEGRHQGSGVKIILISSVVLSILFFLIVYAFTHLILLLISLI
ncbi:MAG: DUF4112 domain-containing protein [Chitinivibrionales bacterium]|nr:DUF4112 domain-containing protein [Chitinivibrionales bacterium]